MEITVNPLPNVNYTHDSILFRRRKQISNSTTEVQNHYWTLSDGSTSGLYPPSFSIDTVGFSNYIAETNKAQDSANSSIGF